MLRLNPMRKIEIPPGPRRLLQYLRKHPPWWELGFVRASQLLLALELGTREKTVRQWARKLVDLGLITIARDRHGLIYSPGEASFDERMKKTWRPSA